MTRVQIWDLIMFSQGKLVAEKQHETKQSAAAIYWGTFDPVTKAHFGIIKQILTLNFEKLIVAINDNKETGKIYKTPGESRLEMLRIMRASLPIADQKRLIILLQNNKEFEYQNIKQMLPGRKVTAIVGQDSFESSIKDCQWCDQVLVAPRGEKSVELEDAIQKSGLKNINIQPFDKTFLATSSTSVRAAVDNQNQEVLSQSMDPKVLTFINKQGFFRGNFTAQEHHKLKVFKSSSWFNRNRGSRK